MEKLKTVKEILIWIDLRKKELLTKIRNGFFGNLAHESGKIKILDEIKEAVSDE